MYVVAAIHPWNKEAFKRHTSGMQGRWHFISQKEKLNIKYIREINPKYIFFPHWSWRVPNEIIKEFECVCFHMTDLPYGRGGSPLQNLIVRGHRKTKVCALKMDEEYDAGGIYLKADLSLEGRAIDIYKELAEIIFHMIDKIISSNFQPMPQQGDPVYFRRREPEQSELPYTLSNTQLYDHIRMTDAEGYPLAYLDWGEWRISFSEAGVNSDGKIVARATFEKKEKYDRGC